VPERGQPCQGVLPQGDRVGQRDVRVPEPVDDLIGGGPVVNDERPLRRDRAPDLPALAQRVAVEDDDAHGAEFNPFQRDRKPESRLPRSAPSDSARGASRPAGEGPASLARPARRSGDGDGTATRAPPRTSPPCGVPGPHPPGRTRPGGTRRSPCTPHRRGTRPPATRGGARPSRGAGPPAPETIGTASPSRAPAR